MKTKQEEKEILERGLTFYFSCKLCEKLGWASKCYDKQKCGQRLYKLLQWHFNKEDEALYEKKEDLHFRINNPKCRV